jgi:hypothetical protein
VKLNEPDSVVGKERVGSENEALVDALTERDTCREGDGDFVARRLNVSEILRVLEAFVVGVLGWVVDAEGSELPDSVALAAPEVVADRLGVADSDTVAAFEYDIVVPVLEGVLNDLVADRVLRRVNVTVSYRVMVRVRDCEVVEVDDAVVSMEKVAVLEREDEDERVPVESTDEVAESL